MLDLLHLAQVIVPVEMTAPEEFVQQAWDYVLPSITVFCSAVIGFKVLSALIRAGSGN